MGRDKEENEDLIRYGFERDVWFHVDGLSSAHVYARLPPGMPWTDMPARVIHDCCQIVKHNSIAGCKLPQCRVVYTPWRNLKKTAAMAVGQVGFVDGGSANVARTTVETDREVIKLLERTRMEPSDMATSHDLARCKEEEDKARQADRRAEAEARRRAERDARDARAAEKEARSFKRLDDDAMKDETKERLAAYSGFAEAEDDFM